MKALVFEEYNSAVSQNITSIPTIVFEHQYPVAGAQPLEANEDIVEKIEKFLESESDQ